MRQRTSKNRSSLVTHTFNACLLSIFGLLSSVAPALAAVRTVQLPLRFDANRGQTDSRVQFLAGGAGYRIFLTRDAAVLRLNADARTGGEPSVIRLHFANASADAKAEGVDLQPGTSSYFIGNDSSRWHRDVPAYAGVRYAAIYPGIDLVYYGDQSRLEYDLVVTPHADPRQIAIAFDGIQTSRIDEDGNLVLTTRSGEIVQHKPAVYQEICGVRVRVDGRYIVRPRGVIGFQIGPYDIDETLVIDPVLSYATFLGGNSNDIGHAIGTDAAGNAYVAGETTSTDFPGTASSAIQSTQAGSQDVFVSKINPAGTALLYSAYLGGSNSDVAYAIAVNRAGEAYVTGESDSGGVTPGSVAYPLLNAFQGTYHGGGDAFITKLNAAGDAILFSTFYGGSGVERGYGIAVDADGSAYITGHTNSSVGICAVNCFPIAGAFQSDNAAFGNYDAFVAKLSNSGGLVYSTFLGGTGSEYSLDGGGIAVDSAGDAYVTGNTASGFPGASSSPIQSLYGGGNDDAFVVKFNAAGNALLYSTYLGGSGYDAAYGIGVAPDGSAVVAGYTDSQNFHTAAALQPANGAASGNDGFVAKINPAGTALVYSTYLGGSGGDQAFDVSADRYGNAFVCGTTSSANFPTVAPFQPANASSGDAFVSMVNPSGTALTYSSFLGGSVGGELAHGITVDRAGSAYVAGSTSSTNFPVTAGSVQTTYGLGGTDAFVAKVTAAFPLGDANGDGEVTSADIFLLIDSLFAGGPSPNGFWDADGDDQLTVADVFYLINFLFAGGADPI